ncbi:MAG: hypothetical protein GXO90_02975 [FCB group bacterium]|nr:hypothetical protein [FCB group bacterium]
MLRQGPHSSGGIGVWLLTVGLFIGCNQDPGLGPVSGVEGILSIADAWPDTVTAVVLAVLTEPDPDHLADVLIAYSEPLVQGIMSQDFFIQLPPGAYLLAPVGVTIDPGFLIANLDSILAAPHLPLVPLFDGTVYPPQGIVSIAIAQESVAAIDTLFIHFP